MSDKDLIEVVMTRGAAETFKQALLAASVRTRRDEHEEDWLLWGYGRVDLACRTADKAEARPVPAGARETDPGRSATEKEAGDG